MFGGRYEIRALLGSGGMARVHLAYDTRLGRTVALKTLLPELARDPEARRRFAREARAAAGLNHPGIVTVHDQDEITTQDAVVPFLVMEHIEGRTLSELARDQAPMEIERAVRITCDILDALAHAHARGLVHRDVKPSNVLITTGGAVKVADFGIARVVHSLTGLTGTGSAIGTPGYMSPEQCAGDAVDARSDLYAVACMLTELLTGTVPFTGATPLGVMYAHVHRTPMPPSARNPTVPPALDAIVLSALSKNPALRPRSAGQMKDRLSGWLASRTPPTAPRALPAPPQQAPMPQHPAYNPPSYGPWAVPAQRPGWDSTPTPPVPGPRVPRRRWGVIGAATAAVAAVLITVAVVVNPFGGDKKKDPVTPVAQDLIAARRSTGGYNGALTGAVSPSAARGGTLRLISAYAPDSLDPARTYSPLVWNLGRLYLRKLVDFAPQPGAAGTRLAPDLATTTGRISDGGRTYTYTLKEHIAFEDGTPITSKDVKYGIERSFAADLSAGGPTHLRDLLDQGQNYPGPYKDTDPDQLGLKSVGTPDDRTIVFHLDAPFADFPYVLALPMSSPVPKGKDSRMSYEKQPVASGPYRIASYDAAKGLTLVRNDRWDASTDSIRTALPDTVELTIAPDAAAVDTALLDGTADLDAAQTGVQDAARARILADDTLKSRADLVTTGAVRYFSLQTAVAPFDDYRCRWAVQYAADRRVLRDALGGADAGDIAGGMLPPTVGGHDRHLDTYGTVTGGSYPEQARRFLGECGHAKGFSTVIAASGSDPVARRAAQSLRDQLATIGVKATVETPDPADYYSVLADQKKLKAKGWGIALITWQSDWPSPAGFLRPLLLPGSPSNYAALDDREINALMDEADTTTDRNAADNLWRTVDSTAQDRGTLLPFLYDRRLNYRSARLTNAYVQPALGGVDLQALGVRN
ncbi:ABC transporter substrate-binding protein [Streptomyces sp. NPDC088354]|uniref:ABC transporter substrate-binding protein n=1 Tax=unclassified Streptomyces TaxID=2593676 RepID=UPI0029A76AC9|nr:ABC transporter substrate-binding protein [Streptomyces sp. MI02-7b]MDX3074423.1 ABC transporter substrate-binding protein [Streptomyces sp. MI02-7b]